LNKYKPQRFCHNNGGGHHHGGGGGRGDYDNDSTSDVIIINELSGKADCVYGKMVDNSNNINWILENFKDGNKPFVEQKIGTK